MGFGVELKVWGDYACFTRPEMKVERVSYDVITPSASRAIFEAIHWKPAVRWVIDEIAVINPIRFESIRRNELKSIINEEKIRKAMSGKEEDLSTYRGEENITQRASLILKDVCYIIRAHFEMTGEAGPDDNAEKHYNMFLRRARRGQCFYQPYLGCREFPAHFELLTGNTPIISHNKGEVDLGYMLWDIDYSNDMEPIFYRPIMKNGVIKVPDLRSKRD